MAPPDARLRLARRLGVLPVYRDQTGARRETGLETALALTAAMGVDAPTEAAAKAFGTGEALPRDVIVEPGIPPDLVPQGAWELTLEDGGQMEGRGPLPALPLGIHRLSAGQRRWTLLSAPGRLPLPSRDWGVIAPLYGLSETGIGSYDDLADVARALGHAGSGFLGLNPVHAGFPAAPELHSPYTPSHRRRLNALHLGGHAGTGGDLIDYRADIPSQMKALRSAFDAMDKDPAFDTWHLESAESLRRFALHQALSERHGPFWQDWPAALQDPESADCREAARSLRGPMRFHAWLQFRAERALGAAQDAALGAGMRQGLYLDLAVGTHPFGAETWEDRASFAFGATLGAPPDAFSAEGQNWGLAPFNPRSLRARAYAPLAETLRQQLRFSGLLRIDHILGFERAFWVPDGAPGAYVTMPRDAMLAVARIEAARAGAMLVGEDLGNIPRGLRGALEASGILGCRVAIFERSRWDPPRFTRAERYDEAAIASFSTHDLPTWEGWKDGADIEAHRRAGGLDATRAAEETRTRQTERRAFERRIGGAGLDEMHRFLARTPSRLVAVQIENLLGLRDQPNLPGTVEEFPNWRRRLPVTPEALSCHDGLRRTAEIMAASERRGESS